MFFEWCDTCPKEAKKSNFQLPEDSDSYELFIVSGVLKITHGEIILRMGRKMVVLSLGYLNS